jgi:hypothetical protein
MKGYLDVIRTLGSEEIARDRGCEELNALNIKELIVGNIFFGNYLGGYEYIISTNINGTLEGKNNCEHYDIGNWSIDTEEDTLNVKWKYGWDNAKTHLYVIDDMILMYDLETGLFRSSLIYQLSNISNIKEYQF